MKEYRYFIELQHVNGGLTRSRGSVEASNARVAVEKAIHNDPVFGIGRQKETPLGLGDQIRVTVAKSM